MNSAAVQTALRSLVLSLDSLPDAKAWENRRAKPSVAEPYLDEAFVPATTTYTGNGPLGGYAVSTGLYVLTWYDRAEQGVVTLGQAADDVLACYRPGTTTITSAGEAVTIRRDPAPYRGQVKPLEVGRACVVITIPWSVTEHVPALAA